MKPRVINPLKGKTDNGWHFEQEIFHPDGIARAVKSGGGSGNIPKVIVHETEDNNHWPPGRKGKRMEETAKGDSLL